MANMARTIGFNILSKMQDAGLDRKGLAEKLAYSYDEMCKVIEGRIWLPPAELSRVAQELHTTETSLVEQNENFQNLELQYLKKFENTNNLDEVVDLFDLYAELKEAN